MYGNDPALRASLRHRGVGHVLAVASNHRVDAGVRPARGAWAGQAAARARLAAPQHRARVEGLRWHQWALIQIAEPGTGQHRLLIRRNVITGDSHGCGQRHQLGCPAFPPPEALQGRYPEYSVALLARDERALPALLAALDVAVYAGPPLEVPPFTGEDTAAWASREPDLALT